MNRAFRKYHRSLALILALPLALTVLTGMMYTLLAEWFDQSGRITELLLGIHSGELFHLEKFYPLLNGLGFLGLLVTGLSLSGLMRQKPRSHADE